MRRRCGIIAPMALNFDFTFLALLLSDDTQQVGVCRCHVPPFRRKCMCNQSPALELAADESVILTYWQLCDKIADDPFLKGLGARCARVLFRRAYRKAMHRCARFDDAVRQQLTRLHTLEDERCAAIDPPADAFANLLCAAVVPSAEDGRDRAMRELLYHLGRWIYLIDARDDLEEDIANGAYNPIHLRYADEPCDASLEMTLNQSLSRIRAACALLELGGREGLVENILTFGLPAVQSAVLSGSWKEIKKQKIWRNKL